MSNNVIILIGIGALVVIGFVIVVAVVSLASAGNAERGDDRRPPHDHAAAHQGGDSSGFLWHSSGTSPHDRKVDRTPDGAHDEDRHHTLIDGAVGGDSGGNSDSGNTGGDGGGGGGGGGGSD